VATAWRLQAVREQRRTRLTCASVLRYGAGRPYAAPVVLHTHAPKRAERPKYAEHSAATSRGELWYASRAAYESGAARRNVLQAAVYHDPKESFDLGAQSAVRTVSKVCDAYATLTGLEKSGHPAGKALRRAQSKPIGFRDEAAQPYDDRMTTGCCRGTWVGRPWRVHTAERTSRGIALENLKGIRTRVTATHDQRYRLHSLAFAQLGGFIEYKAARAGVPVVHVDPRNTSRQCSECWHTHRSGVPIMVRVPLVRNGDERGPQRLPQHPPPCGRRVAAGQSQLPQPDPNGLSRTRATRGSQPRARPAIKALPAELTSATPRGREADTNAVCLPVYYCQWRAW
jgi:IS605 OrfB family transposase